jgi:hypothetical protein
MATTARLREVVVRTTHPTRWAALACVDPAWSATVQDVWWAPGVLEDDTERRDLRHLLGAGRWFQPDGLQGQEMQWYLDLLLPRSFIHCIAWLFEVSLPEFLGQDGHVALLDRLLDPAATANPSASRRSDAVLRLLRRRGFTHRLPRRAFELLSHLSRRIDRWLDCAFERGSRTAIAYLLDCLDSPDLDPDQQTLTRKTVDAFHRFVMLLDGDSLSPSAAADRERTLLWFVDAHRGAKPGHRDWIPPPSNMLLAAINSSGCRAIQWVLCVGLPRYHPTVAIERLLTADWFPRAMFHLPTSHSFLPWLQAHLLTTTQGCVDLRALVEAYATVYQQHRSLNQDYI